MKHSQEEHWRPRFHAPPLRSHPDPPPTIQCSWYRATSGFSFRTVTQDPAIRKAVDDIVFDFYGEENPCCEEDYNLVPSKEMQMGGM